MSTTTRKAQRLALKKAGWKLEIQATYHWLYKGDKPMTKALDELNAVIFKALREWENSGLYGINGADYSITNLEMITEPKTKKTKEATR